MAAAIAAIIAAVIGAAVTIGTTVANNQDIEAANEEGLRLANQSREDQQEITTNNMKIANMNAELQKSRLGFEVGEAARNREERAEDKSYVKRQNYLANSMNMVNQNQAMRESLLNIWPGLNTQR
jgi:hypothetical protein